MEEDIKLARQIEEINRVSETDKQIIEAKELLGL